MSRQDRRGSTLWRSVAEERKGGNSSPDDLRTIISNGKGHMPKYGGKLTSAEVDTLVEEIKALK